MRPSTESTEKDGRKKEGTTRRRPRINGRREEKENEKRTRATRKGRGIEGRQLTEERTPGVAAPLTRTVIVTFPQENFSTQKSGSHVCQLPNQRPSPFLQY